jgi:glucokinase-like ROK family protein
MNKGSAGRHLRPGKDVAIAIDLGGTNLRLGVVEESGEVIHAKKQPTPGNRESLLQAIQTLVGDGFDFCASKGCSVVGIGISTGGQVDFSSGVIVSATSLIPDWSNVPMGEIMRGRFNVPVFVDNDGNCFARAEKRFGKGNGLDNFIALVLGTGIGGGIYVDGKPLRGAGNFAAEIGHVSVDANGPECSCGGRGCIELFASGSGIARSASENPLLRHLAGPNGEFTSRMIGEASRAGDSSATALLDAAGERLGVAMAGMVNAFNPECIIISGSLLELESPFLDTFRNTVMRRAMKANVKTLRIETSDIPQEGGILGAASLAFDAFEEAGSRSRATRD